jgi:hypothetical protein
LFQARQDLSEPPEGDGLTHEIHRAEPQTLSGLPFRGHPGHGDDGHLAFARSLQSQEVEPTHGRQVQVQQDGVQGFGLDRLQRALGRFGDHGLVAKLAQKLAEDLADGRFVLDDQHAHASTDSKSQTSPA